MAALPVNPELPKQSPMVTAETVHTTVTQENNKPKTRNQRRKDARTKRQLAQSRGNSALPKNVTTVPISSEVASVEKPIAASAFTKAKHEFKSIWDDIPQSGKKIYDFFKKNPWGKRIGYIGLGVVGLNLATGMFNNIFRRNGAAIPDQYERGYDTINESLTDFGSPVKLAKAAQKIINPYYSTVRKATVTTIKTVQDSNIALLLNKNAIRHTRY